MDTKTKISANGTYVLDSEDLEQLDELSLTSVINAIPEAQQSPKQPPKQPPKSSKAPAPDAGDTTINEILRGAPATPDRPPAAVPPNADPAESTGDLLDPELIFTERTPPRR
jgi:hypothetical protein